MVTLNNTEYSIQKAKFRQFLCLQEIDEQIHAATSYTTQADLICRCVSQYLNLPQEQLQNEPWKNVAMAYVAILTKNLLDIKIPFLKAYPHKIEPIPWDYPGRDWYAYAHLFSKEYGWNLDYVANLEVEDAIKLLQEILVEEQLQREWQWELSERSTGYDEATKKAKHIDLPRPDWMIMVPLPPKKVRIPLSLLPQGLVIRPDGSHVEFK